MKTKFFRIGKIASVIVGLMIGCAVLLHVCIYLGPNYVLYRPYDITLYTEEDQTIYSRHFHQEGSYVELEKISPHTIHALIASEDKRFYQHHGLDYARIIKSAWNNLWNGRLSEGGSTITQQYARTIFLSNEKTFSRKLKEAWIARKIEMTYSKEEILEGYLNAAYFGHNLYGIDQASRYFFHKIPSALSVAESALLIGLLSSPTSYSPENNQTLAENKKNQVLKKMYEQKYITDREYLEATKEKLTYYFSFPNSTSSQMLYYYDGVIKELEERQLYTPYNQKIGLNVYSTFIPEIQSQIEQVLSQYHFSSEISVIVMKPYTGDILAMVGGKNYQESPFNRALYAKRQTGSAIKPLLYYLGLENGMTPLTKMKSEPTTFYIDGIGEYAPRNANDQYAYRDITMLEAIALSDNIYATKTTLLLGSSSLQSLLKHFGISDAEANPTIGLGSNAMTPLQLTSIFNTFASEGAYYHPTFLKKVERKTGEILYQKAASPKFYLGRNSVIQLNYLLRSPFDQALKTYATPSMLGYEPTARFSVKTGTTDSDRWIVGYNPQYTISVWMGNDDNTLFKDGSIAKKIFQQIANAMMKRHKDYFYPTYQLKSFYYQANGKTSYSYYQK